MMATISQIVSSSHPVYLRPFDARRDLLPVADLVELCFSEHLDPDGRRYLNQLRATASQANLPGWAVAAVSRLNTPMDGYVWEQDGRVVGNLSLIPFPRAGRRIELIANVAVHPDYRRRGIARALTLTAIRKIQGRGNATIWLQVRADNPAAVSLYEQLGFHEQARRTTWVMEPHHLKNQPVAGAQVGIRKRGHWEAHKRWLQSAYPLHLRWYLPLRTAVMQPGLAGFLIRFFNDRQLRHWSAWQGADLLGVLTWQSSHSYADRLWLAVDPQQAEIAISALMGKLSRQRALRRTVTLDYPAGEAVTSLTAAGFSAQHTLIWMDLQT
ncbi:MAG: GNAT family N-acetyltransferase [Anaerolineales bacterium]|nr:GNAT family N-acetyltransferase [Anaerolineales bacterium]